MWNSSVVADTTHVNGYRETVTVVFLVIHILTDNNILYMLTNNIYIKGM